MISSLEFVLVAIMVMENPNTKALELNYVPMDYFKTMQVCNIEKNRIQRKTSNNKVYICLKVDRD
jgi:hypothetical protein